MLVPFLWTINPKNLPKETLKVHFKGLICKLYCLHLMKTFNEIIDVVTGFPGLFHIIINIFLEAFVQHVMEDSSHYAMISGT